MTSGTLRKCFDRRGVLSLIALGGSSAIARAARTNKLTVRDVVTILVKARNGQPPDLSHRDLSDLDLAGLDFKRADLTGSNLFGADLTASNLESANLSRAVLDRATLVRTGFANATLQDASMRRPSVFSDMRFDPRDLPVFRAANMAGARITARLDGADFSGADLSNASFAVWQERDLGGAPTSGLARCNFTGARMRRVNMRGLSLAQASLEKADLRDADLRDTDLTGANFTGAVLKGARLDRAKLDGTVGLSSSPRD
jgi:uncharacterized protein YjbI with pentapeptide repeats